MITVNSSLSSIFNTIPAFEHVLRRRLGTFLLVALAIVVALTISLFSSYAIAQSQSHTVVGAPSKKANASEVKFNRYITVGIGAHNSPPYALTKGDQIVGGVIYDLVNELSDILDVNVNYLYVPRKRIESYINSGKVDFYPIANPDWLDISEGQWSAPLFKEKNVIVLNNGAPDISQLSDLDNKTIGTIRGFVYPSLTQALEEKRFERTDVRSLNLNFERLEKHWIDGFIASDILVDYFIKTSGKADSFDIASFIVSEHYIQAVVSDKSSVKVGRAK